MIRLHAVLPTSRANGPGERFVVWFQGCSLGCPGCSNPETHAASGRFVPVSALVGRILQSSRNLEGITLSGGEPFQQPDALLALLRSVREHLPRLSVVVFSGFTRSEIERQPNGVAILSMVDVLIAGRFVARRYERRGYLTSSNQVMHLLTDRYTRDDFAGLPDVEAHVSPDGEITLTGVRVAML